MRMSCNGCRVLRKGCSEGCSIRPCLQWIKSPEAQAHATVFLAKFYGRAGLMNLINSGPDHLRPAVFRSLLYEACGRIVNPIYGSVGLLWSGSWPMVEAAVEAVLKGAPIVSIPSETAAAAPVPHPTYDIRHVSKAAAADAELHKVNKATRTRFKRTANKSGKAINPSPPPQTETEPEITQDSSSDPNHLAEPMCLDAHREASVDTVEAGSHVSQGEPEPCNEMGLDLTLGFGVEPTRRDAGDQSEPTMTTNRCELSSGESFGPCSLGLALQLSA